MIKPFLSTAVLLLETIKSDVMKLIKVYLVIAAFLGTMISTNTNSSKRVSKTWNRRKNGIQPKSYCSQEDKLLLRRWRMV